MLKCYSAEVLICCLQAFSGYQALYNTNLKVVFKPFRAIKPCIRLALELLSLSIA